MFIISEGFVCIDHIYCSVIMIMHASEMWRSACVEPTPNAIALAVARSVVENHFLFCNMGS